MDLKTKSIITNVCIGLIIFVVLAAVLLSIGEFADGGLLAFHFPKTFSEYCRETLIGITFVISYIEIIVLKLICDKKICVIDFATATIFSIFTGSVIYWIVSSDYDICYIPTIGTGLALFFVIEINWLILSYYDAKQLVRLYSIVANIVGGLLGFIFCFPFNVIFLVLAIALCFKYRNKIVYNILLYLGFFSSLCATVVLMLPSLLFFYGIHPT